MTQRVGLSFVRPLPHFPPFVAEERRDKKRATTNALASFISLPCHGYYVLNVTTPLPGHKLGLPFFYRHSLAAGAENWMLSYKTTVLVALNKETQEEVGRHLVTGHGLFTVADRTCTAETCGNSEGAEMPVRKKSCAHRTDHGPGYLL